MKKKTYIQPEAIIELMDPEGLMDTLQNASKETFRGNAEDASAFSKQNNSIFFSDDDDWGATDMTEDEN